jgi:4-hydroxy-3-methylbut-2-enyl diphosphate reductase
VGNEVTEFEKLLEESLKEIRSGSITKGVVANVANGNIIIDLGLKYDGIMPYSEYSDEAEHNPENELKVGQEIEAYVVRVNDMDGTVLLSRRKIEGMKMWEEIDNWIESKKPVDVKVIKDVGAGLIANKNGIQVFIPASQLAEKDARLEDYVGRNLKVRFLEVNKDRKRVVASERVLAREARAEQEAAVWAKIKEGEQLTGTVKQLEKFGAFVDLGGVDGLIHISELSWGRIKSPSEVLSVGQPVTVYVLSVDKENRKIALGYKKAEDNPWNNIEDKYHVGDVVEVKIERLVPFGAFAQLEVGLEGLIHISQISHKRVGTPAEVLKVGQYVNAKIMEIDTEKKKIELSMKELEEPEIDLKEKEETPTEKATEEVKTEAPVEEKVVEEVKAETFAEEKVVEEVKAETPTEEKAVEEVKTEEPTEEVEENVSTDADEDEVKHY